MKRQLSDYKKSMLATIKGIRQFRSRITYLEMSIDRGISQLPELHKQIEHFETMLPIWKKELKVQKKSLVRHLAFLKKRRTKHEIAAKIEATQRKLKGLDRELRRMA